MSENFGIYLDEKREQAGFLWSELAEKLAISRQHMTDIHKGRRTPTDTTLELIRLTLQLNRDEVYWMAGKLPPDIKDLMLEAGPEYWRHMRRPYYQAEVS